jgi:citrate lyase beta subunit
MESFFFVPASKLIKLEAIHSIGVDEIIIDFEDSILSNDREIYFEILKKTPNIEDYWIRAPLRETFNDSINIDFITKLIGIGVVKIVIPKLISSSELLSLVAQFKQIKFILLIEHPRLLLEIKDFFRMHPEFIKKFYGIGIGSHDLMSFLGALHKPSQLDYPRKKMLFLAKAYGLKAIDIASMNIYKNEDFYKELEYAKENGFDGKFLIHPNQFDWLKEYEKNNKDELIWAKKIISRLPKNYKGDSIEPFIFENMVVEKMHVTKALEIIKKYNYGK